VQPSVLGGELRVLGDKSIAHRALMLAALADGTSHIRNLPAGEDVRSTAACMRGLGAMVAAWDAEARVVSSGVLEPPQTDLDAGNSGTTMRLLAGILAGQPFHSCLDGDASLRRRPMDRVIEPLSRMGAAIRSENGRAPLVIEGDELRPISYRLPVASGQVKSAVLLAGLFATGTTRVVEPVPARDHTERMLLATGVPVARNGDTVSVEGGVQPAPFALSVPGDISSAAFFLAGAALTGGELTIADVGINPTRTGFLDVLARMGAEVEMTEERQEAGEPAATVRIRGACRRPVSIEPKEVPRLIDELPLVALLATQAEGRSVVRGAAELRVKESDRIATVATQLGRLGAEIKEHADGFTVRGPSRLTGATVESGGDHRLAMLLAIAGCVAAGETIVEGAEASAVSYPRFERALAGVGGRIDVI
jgi:3-phosphoshikimate 1-carboxyvinyltransferase